MEKKNRLESKEITFRLLEQKMKPKKKIKRKFNSFEEYKKEFYPNTSTENLLSFDDPHNLGINMAKKSLKELDQLLLQK